MTAPQQVYTDPTQTPPEGLTDDEQRAVAALTTFLAEAALAGTVALPPALYAMLLRLGLSKTAVRAAVRLGTIPLGRRHGTGPHTERRSARVQGTAAAAVADEEPGWRARYILAAAQRLERDLQLPQPDGTGDVVDARRRRVRAAVEAERRNQARHEAAGRRRARAAAEVDRVVEESGSPWLTWRLGQAEQHTPGCVWADGRTFTVDDPLVFSDEAGLPAKPQWPGAVHPQCKCWPAPFGDTFSARPVPPLD